MERDVNPDKVNHLSRMSTEFTEKPSDMETLIRSLPYAITQSLPYALAEGRMGGKKQFLPSIIQTLPNILKFACVISPENGVLHVDEAGHERMQTNSGIFRQAKCILGALRGKGLKPGAQVVMQIKDAPSFLVAFWGTVLGGFVPVPLAVPGGFPVSEGMDRILKVCKVLDRFCILTDQPAENYADVGKAMILTYRELLDHAPDNRIYTPKSGDVALLQFSSGSTGDPKGIMLTHRNIISCIEAGSMSFIYATQGDYRPMAGYLVHFVKRLLFKTDAPGVISRAILKLANSHKKYLAETPALKPVIDTLMIVSGNRVSAQLDMHFNDIRMANWMPYSHVMGLIGFHLGPTAAGFHQISMEPKTFIENPTLFLRLIERYKVSYVPCPNFAAEWLTLQVKDEDIAGLDLSSIKMLGNGSEPISPSVTRNFIQKFKKFGFDPRAMCMGFGMSEATAEITFPRRFEPPRFHRVLKETFFRDNIILPTPSEESSIELADLGVPLQCAKIRIVDDNDQLLHENMVGHIQIKGPTVTKGYLNNPEANKNLFCDGWLRTGDMGFLIRGRLVITGRLKDIIFVNGQNLYAHDIEEIIKKAPGMALKEFAITGLRDYGSDSEKIVLFVNINEPKESLAARLSRINKTLLAEIGVMADFLVPVDEIPRTSTAKIKRFQLRTAFERGAYHERVTADDAATLLRVQDQVSETALSREEKQLIGIWKAVTQVSEIGRFDNFFDLGGNSLKATKVTSRIREEFGVDLPIRAIFEHQTIAELLQAISAIKHSGTVSTFSLIEKPPVMEFYDVSHAQRRLWYLDKVVPGSPFYNIPAAVLLDNTPIDVGVFKTAIQAVVNRHETLRTTFPTVEERPVQRIANSLEIDIPVIDLTSETSKQETLRRLIEEEKLKPFNLEQGPLLRATVVKLSDTSHAFILIMHHIISDGWSMGLLIQETLLNYLAFKENNPSPFPELAIQYKDFAHWQNRIIEGSEIKSQEAYWLESLKGELPVLNLPTERPRPPVQTQNGATRRIRIDHELAGKISDLARKLDVTPFMLTLSTFTLLLHKLSGQDDIIVGSPLANRNNTSIEPLIGFFVNVLPLRVNLEANPRFTDFLHQVKQISLGAYANQDYPFDKLVEVVNPIRDMSRSPVFDVVFEFRDVYAESFINANQGDVIVQNITGDDPNAKFDLFATYSEGAEGITVQFEYNADLFSSAAIERWMGYLLNLTKEILDAPEKRLSEIEMLGREEKERILFTFNDTTTEFPKHLCTHELFEEQVRRFPEKEALIFGETKVSYADLNEMSNKIARYLRAHGVVKGSYVGIMVERSIDMIAGVIGILKAGGAYVPIEPEYPLSRIKYMIDEIAAPVIIVHENLMVNMPDYTGAVMCLERFWKESEAIDGSDLENINTPGDIAYVIYTSGSTGNPKGVMVPHVAISRLVKNTNFVDFTPDDRFLQIATFAFDAATLEFWGALLNGGVLVLAKSADVMAPDTLADLLLDNNITIIFLTVVLYNQLVDTRPDGITKMKRLLVGGEALSVAHIKKGLEYTGPGVLANGYGPTENTTFSCTYTVDSVPEAATSIPIGFPLANSTVYILDKYLKPVPVGTPGEIYFGGYGLAKGYLNDPEKTAKTFVNNPIPEVKDAVLYKSGDLGRWLPNGSVDFLGRIDHQVKIRGHRIELGEIEAALRKIDAIKDAVCIVKPLDDGNKMLLAYYVAAEEIPIDHLRSTLKERLPDYMIPNLFIRLDALPLNQNGKVDKKALPEPKGLRPEMTTGYVEPVSDIEVAIADAWKAVLGIDKVGIYDNFFDLGGDSIISLQVVNRLNQKGLKLQARDVLMHQTIAELATIAEECKGVEAEQGVVTGIAPLTPIQKWFFNQQPVNSNHFNQSLMFRSRTPLDGEALKKSLQTLVDHHDALRMRFDRGVQENRPLGEAPLFMVKPVESNEALIDAVKTLQSAFNIVDGPLFGAGLFRMGVEDCLVLAAHHLVVDGVSWRILLEDLLTAYGAITSGSPIALPPKTSSFKEWANRLEEYAATPDLDAEKAFWEEMAQSGIPAIPVDHDLGPNTIAFSGKVRLELTPEETAHLLKDAHKAYNTDVNDLLIASLMNVFSGWRGEDRVVFDLEGHGREDVMENIDISRTVGWFTTVYPVILEPPLGADLAAQIKYVKETLHTIPHKGFNYGIFTCKKDMKWPINTGISFNYLGQVTLPETGESMSGADFDVPGTIAPDYLRPNLIDVICMTTGNRLRIDFIFSENKHRRETIETLAGSFKEALLAVIDHCLDPESFDITPSDFDLVDLDQDMLDSLTSFE